VFECLRGSCNIVGGVIYQTYSTKGDLGNIADLQIFGPRLVPSCSTNTFIALGRFTGGGSTWYKLPAVWGITQGRALVSSLQTNKEAVLTTTYSPTNGTIV